MVIILHKELEVVKAWVSFLKLECAAQQNGFKMSSKFHTETEVGLAKNLGETHDDSV